MMAYQLAKMEEAIKELTTEMKSMRVEINEIKPRLSVLEWKSGMWGAIAGAVMILGALLMQNL